jgi:transposase
VHVIDSIWLEIGMRGEDHRAENFFSYLRLEDRIPINHPLRSIREIVDAALAQLSRAFDKLYAREGRPSIPPERLLRALLLQAFFTIRSERQLMEQLNYNLLFRWFVGLAMDDAVWDATVFCKNRDRLLDGDIARKFMTTALNLPQAHRSRPHAARDARPSRSPASTSAPRMRSISALPSLTSGGRTTARGNWPSKTSASFMRLCMSTNGSA